jgi:transposase-like protein
MMSQRKKLKMVSSDEARVAVAELVQAGSAEARADPEVRAVAKRRQFSAAYKLSVLGEADRASEPGAIGALLRREGLYSSQLTQWRRERDTGALEALSRRRGRKAKMTAEQKRIAALEARNARLEHELSQAHTIIDVQKKLCTLLGLPTAAQEANNGSES